jgi:HAMP domain-containing protein
MGPVRPRRTADSNSVFRSIRAKLLLLTVLPTMLAVLVVGGVLTTCQTAHLKTELLAKTSRYGELLAVQLRSAIAFDDRETARETLDGLVRDDDVVSVRLYNEARQELYTYGRKRDLAPVEGAAPVEAGDAFAIAMPIKSLEGPRGSIEVAVSTKSLAAERARVIRITAIVALFAALLAFLIAFPIARRMSGRVQGVARYATRIASGDLETKPIDERGHDEVSQTAAAVN